MPQAADKNRESRDSRESRESREAADAAPQASRAAAPVVKAWPFAPGSQLDKQVAKPFKPKPSYRFNQR